MLFQKAVFSVSETLALQSAIQITGFFRHIAIFIIRDHLSDKHGTVIVETVNGFDTTVPSQLP